MSQSFDVILLHEAREDDPYEAAFQAAGYEPQSVPVLRFEQVQQDALRHALTHPARYGGLVITSPRATDALDEALVWLPGQSAAWEGKPAFVAGPRTAEALRELGFTPKGKDTGSAEKLAERIQRRSFEKPLLFLCGNRRRDVLPDRLREQGIDLEELCVYETHLREDLSLPDTAEWLVFFSPSGVEGGLGRADRSVIENVRYAALGPTTAQALRQAGRAVAAVADTPTPDALVAAVSSASSG